jgi:hypothetical protein
LKKAFDDFSRYSIEVLFEAIEKYKTEFDPACIFYSAMEDVAYWIYDTGSSDDRERIKSTIDSLEKERTEERWLLTCESVIKVFS